MLKKLLLWFKNLFRKKPEWKLKAGGEYGGSIIKTGDSYRVTNRTNPNLDFSNPKSNKALISYDKKHKPVNGREVLYSFKFKITKFNFDFAPDWWVMFQDWTRIVKGDSNGNRPITTLEIKSYGDKLFLRHKDSSFQWELGPDKPPRNNGEIEIKVGIEYLIDMIITDGTDSKSGGASLIVDGIVITNVQYQTKSKTQWKECVQEVGIYHANNHNRECDPLKQVEIVVSELSRKVM